MELQVRSAVAAARAHHAVAEDYGERICCDRASRRASTGSARPGSGIGRSSARIRSGRLGRVLGPASQPSIFQIQSVIICGFPRSGRKGGDNSLRARRNSLRRRVGNFLANNWIRRCFREGFRGNTADLRRNSLLFPYDQGIRHTIEPWKPECRIASASLFHAVIHILLMRTISSSPRYEPVWTSISSKLILPRDWRADGSPRSAGRSTRSHARSASPRRASPRRCP